MFLAGMIIVIAGAAIVLVFAPRGKATATPDAGLIKRDLRDVERKPSKPEPVAESPRKDPPDAAEPAATT
jgi:hypothetical protein